ncbi:hypothetical protein TREES_T100012193 [Tupaia chinensis]|uniref:Uncharacterized protein n=1 Tax=Tupaia chinensis TaxID=246437 RepID=L9JHN4_TUPCH|nr:hypothetical protein TREES_T100012193 [Tupaia chinensis]
MLTSLKSERWRIRKQIRRCSHKAGGHLGPAGATARCSPEPAACIALSVLAGQLQEELHLEWQNQLQQHQHDKDKFLQQHLLQMNERVEQLDLGKGASKGGQGEGVLSAMASSTAGADE